MDGYVTIGTKLNTDDFDREIKHLTTNLENLEDEYARISNEKPFEGQEKSLKKISSEIVSTKKKIETLRNQQEKLNNTGFKGFSQSLEGVIGKITKWGLALFGIRSAYNFIRQSVSILSSENEQLSTDIEYIKYAIASTLQPIIERIIQLVYKLLSLINSISYSLFGVNLFANANAKSLNKSVSAAKELKKQLAGFDEMNVLQNTSSESGSGGGSTPSFDLSKITDLDKAEKIKNFWNDIIKFWEEDWVNYFGSASGKWDLFVQGLGLTFKGFYDIFKGIIEIIVGVWDFLVALFKGDYEGLNEAWKKLWDGCKDIFKGIIEIVVGILFVTVGTIKGIFLEIVDFIYIKIIKPIGNFFVSLWNGITTGVSNAVNFIKNTFNSVVIFFKNIISKIVDLFKDIGTKVGDVIGGAFKTVINGVLKAIESILNSPIKSINKLIDVINSVPGIDLGVLPTFKLPRLAKGGILNQPGRGVMVGSAIAGESGKEGVLPLTDSQQMSLLGEAIGRYITINANITNNMDGKVITREIKRIQNEQDFAFNR